MAVFKKAKAVLPAPKSVASITAGLSDTLAELEAHAGSQAAQAELQEEAAKRSLQYAAEHKAESELALKVAGNIKSLLGA